MTIAELQQELERRRTEKRELDEQRRMLEDEATRRRLIMEVLKQREENRAIKQQLRDKYKFHWQQESSESESDDEIENKSLAARLPETARPIVPQGTTSPTPSTSASMLREGDRPEARTTASKRATAQPRNQQGRFSRQFQTELETTAETKKKRAPPKKKQATRLPQPKLISILKPVQQLSKEPSPPQQLMIELVDPTIKETNVQPLKYNKVKWKRISTEKQSVQTTVTEKTTTTYHRVEATKTPMKTTTVEKTKRPGPAFTKKKQQKTIASLTDTDEEETRSTIRAIDPINDPQLTMITTVI